jgi:NAD(P)-dependent dehydrogenase (short-subunit alcohol dehydrogenase family)
VGAGYLAWNHLRRPSLNLHGRIVLITGGSRGLGLQLAREFGGQGATVAICARDEAELQLAEADLSRRGIPAHTVVCDVADREQVQSMVDQVRRTAGPIDILVNNAGLIQVGPFSAMTVEDFERAMNVMFWGAVYNTLAVLPSMLERRQGQIVNVTSIGGKLSVPHLLPYCCAKFALSALSEGLRVELASNGIRVTTVVPGLMRTGSHLKAEFKGKHRREYAWFAASAATEFVSIGAERAARSIVKATLRGQSEKILSLPADLLARVHHLLPEMTLSILSAVNRVLPAAGPSSLNYIKTGENVEKAMNSRLWQFLTRPGQTAAASLNESS